MKTTIEINGFEIVISEQEGAVVVSAIKGDETVEEFTLEIEDVQDAPDAEGSEDLVDFAQEEGDFSQAQAQAQIQGIPQTQGEDDEVKLESFNSFIEKRK